MHPIERYRRVKGWTQAELAKLVGVNVNSVQGWERGARPRPKHLVALANVLGLDPLQLQNEMEAWAEEQSNSKQP